MGYREDFSDRFEHQFDVRDTDTGALLAFYDTSVEVAVFTVEEQIVRSSMSLADFRAECGQLYGGY